ncbi:MAG: hypothetical protein AB2822_06880 [Candidatus Thiodiazotropha endolucinida]
MKRYQIRMILAVCIVPAISLLSACGSGDSNDSASDQENSSDSSYSISGTVSGMTGSGLVLQNNGTDDLTIAADGGFSFATPVIQADSYAVTIAAQPGDQICSVTNGSGTATGEVSDIQINCSSLVVPTLNLVSGDLKILSFSWSDVGADYYRLLKNPDGISGYTQVGEDLTQTQKDEEIAVHLTDWVNASYMVQACRLTGECVDSSSIDIYPQMLDAIGYIKASNTACCANFGNSVALSADGGTMVVGATGDSSLSRGFDRAQTDAGPGAYRYIRSGAVYVFVHNDDSWRQQAFIKASNADARDYFGHSLSLSEDGNTLAVGVGSEDSAATGINGDENDNTREGTGAVYIFVRTGSSWQQQAYIKASLTDRRDGFGLGLALSADGDTLAVGAYGEDSNADGVDGDQLDNSAENAGAVYLFTRTDNSWVQQAYLKASNSDAGDFFGSDLAFSGDGERLAVSAIYEASAASGIDGDQLDNSATEAGAVYLFERTQGAWTQVTYLKASTIESYDRFGSGLAFSSDGEWLAVGAPDKQLPLSAFDDEQQTDSSYTVGAVYLFKYNDGAWQQGSYVRYPHFIEDSVCRGQRSGFGGSVSFSGDGGLLAIGAASEDSSAVGIDGEYADGIVRDAGAVYLFERDGNAWSQRAYVKASHFDPEPLLFGDPFDNCVGTRPKYFGVSVSLSSDGHTLAVGASGEDSSATGIGGNQEDNSTGGAGAVYLY